MYCDACGAQLQEGQRFCGACGKPIGTGAAAPVEGRVTRHLRLLAVLWIAISVFRLLGAGVLFLVGNVLFPSIFRGGAPIAVQRFLPLLLSSIGTFLLIKACFGFLTAWGLLEKQTWARLLALILGFLALLDIPFGTALGIYTLWVLLPMQSDEEYRRLAGG